MSSAPTADDIARDARWLAQALDAKAGLVRLVEMDREAYRSASFLDDRMLQHPVKAQVLPWPQVAAAVPAGARRDARWIFHIGHVGSTLIARLLGELDGVLAIREPRLLRDLALLPPAERGPFLPVVQTLLSRGFGQDEIALVKATSLVSEIAAALVPQAERALFLFASPERYVQTILAGENSRVELRMMAQYRADRMRGRVSGLEGTGQSDAHLAAAAWACEMTALEASGETMTDRQVLWADFDAMLADLKGWLARLTEFFGFRATVERLGGLASGPLMRRYSKALEHEYSPDLRRELLEEAARENRRDIDDALAMLADAAETSPLLKKALSRSDKER